MTHSASRFPSIKTFEVKYEISFGYHDKETDDWVTLELSEKQKEDFEKILKLISSSGEERLAFAKPGEIFEITEKGIYRKGKDRWVNLLEKAKPEQRKTLARIIKISTKKLREATASSPKKSEKPPLDSEKFIEEVASKSGILERPTDVFIHVKVARVKPKIPEPEPHFAIAASSIQKKEDIFFSKAVKEHRKFVDTLADAERLRLDSEYRNQLMKKGFTEVQIDRMFSYFAHLSNLAGEAQKVFEEIDKLFSDHQWTKGMERFARWVREEFPLYQKALRSAMLFQEWAIARFPEFPESLLIHAQDLVFFERLYTATLSSIEERLKTREKDWAIDFKKLALESWIDHSRVIDELWSTEWNFVNRVQQFARLIETYRDRFDYFLEKKGFSKVEIAFLFGYFPRVAKEMEFLEAELKTVKEFSDQKKFQEAQQKYAKIILESYNQYVTLMQSGALAMKLTLSRERVQDLNKAIEKFLESLGESVFLPKERIVDFVQRPPRHKLLWDEVKKKYPDKSEFAIKFSETEKRLLDVNEAFNEMIHSYDDLTSNDLEAEKDLLNPILLKDEEFKKAVLHRPWSEKQFREFYAIVNEYGNEVNSLYIAWKALQNDPDNIDMKNEVKKLATNTIPRLEKLNERVNRLGGWKAVENVLLAFERFRDNLENRLKLAEAMQKQGISREALKSLPATLEKHALEKLFEPTGMKHLQDMLEAMSGVEVFSIYRQKGDFLNDFYAALHFTDAIFLETLTSSLLSKDENWKNLLAKAGWTETKIKIVNHAYISLMRETEALRDLQKLYEKQPTNLRLKQELHALALEKKDRIAQLQNDIKKAGGKEGFSKLASAVANQREIVNKNLRTTLSSSEKVLLNRQLKLLEKVDHFEQEIEDAFLFLHDLSSTLHLRQDVFSGQFPLVQMGKVNYIDQFLRKHGWNWEMVKKMDSFFSAYFKAVDRLEELKMLYDSDPFNKKNKEELRRALEENLPKIQSLHKRFENSFGKIKIQDLLTALDEYKNALDVQLENIIALEMATEKSKMKTKETEEVPKKKFEIEAALTKLTKIDLKAQFFNKFSVVGELYKEFGWRVS